MRVVELLVSATMMWAPPQGAVTEGPSEGEADPDAPVEGEVDTPVEGDPTAASDEDPSPTEGPPADRVQAIVDAAAQAAKDRAWLQRKGTEIQEYVHHLDALADVNGELDTCDAAIQAELRMALALAYLKNDGSCSEDGESSGEQAEEAEAYVGDLPVLECFEAPDSSACADRLLELVAQFGSEGQAGTAAPFSQAFGCTHAAAQMSVEQMFGLCLADEYDAAITRWEGDQDQLGDAGGRQLPVPRWASIAGISGGAVLVITGGVLLGINGKCPGGYDPVTQVADCPSVYNTNAGGGVLVGVGVVAMLGMGTVLAITEIQRKKRSGRESAFRQRLHRAEALTGLRLSMPRPARRL